MGATDILVTAHAAQRWSERVHPCSRQTAVDEIRSHAAAIHVAAEFGARSVKLASRHRLILKGLTVVTVLSEGRMFI